MRGSKDYFRPRGYWSRLTLMSLGTAASTGGHIIWIAFSALMGAALAPKPGLATLPIAIVLCALAMTAGPVSAFMSRHGRRAGFQLGAAGAIAGALAALAAILTGSFALLCMAAVFQGLCSASAQFYRFAAAELAGHERAPRAIGFVLLGNIMAALSVPTAVNAAGLFTADHGLAAFLAALAFGLLALVPPTLLIFAPAPAPPQRQPLLPMGAFLRRPYYWVGVVTASAGNGAMALLMAAAPLAIVHAGHSMHHSTGIIQLHVIAMFLPSLFAGWLIARLGAGRVAAVGVLCLGATILISHAGQGLDHFTWGMLMLGVGWNFTFVAGTTIVTRTHDASERAAAQGLNETIIFGTAALMSLGAGALIDSLGWWGLNLISAGFTGLVAAANISYRLFWPKSAPTRRRKDI